MMENTELIVQGIGKSFGATRALHQVSLHVQGGRILALVGENGAGKSTLMKILSGAQKADAGSMALNGRRYAPGNPLKARHAGVGMIYQELSLVPHLSVAENIVLGNEPTRMGLVLKKRMSAMADEALVTLGHSEIPLEKPVGELSVAERQIVEIARAICNDCRILIFDEPTSSLSQEDAANLFKLLKHLREQGRAIIYISHILEEVFALADDYAVLRDGEMVGGGLIAETTADALVRMMVGRELTELYPHSQRTPGEELLKVSSLTSANHRAQSVDLSLRRGEVLGLAGVVGAGRTDFARAAFGLDGMGAGTVSLASFSGRLSPALSWRLGVGLVSEDRKEEGLALDMSLADNVTMTRLPCLVWPRAQRMQAARWLDELGTKYREAGQPVGDLSGGNQQKVALARLLNHDVDVFLLDEPTRGIDVGAKARIYKLIDERACAGKAVLMISSYLPELMGVCDRIGVFRRGRLVGVKPTADWSTDEIMRSMVG